MTFNIPGVQLRLAHMCAFDLFYTIWQHPQNVGCHSVVMRNGHNYI